MAEGHNIRVVSLLTGDEYLAMQSMADEDGLSDSAFMRRRVSEERDLDNTAEPAQLVRSGS